MAHRRTVLLSVLAAVGVSCAPPPGSEPQAQAAAAPSRAADASWLTTVGARIANGARTFQPGDGGFLAVVPEREMAGSFDTAGAWLSHAPGGQAAGGIGVRTASVGRPDNAWELAPTIPALGACVSGRVDPQGQCVRQLEYAHEGALEWWVAEPEGFEQGWTVDVAPDGEGPLAVDVAIEGARVGVEAGRVHLAGDDGIVVTVTALVAWDADGAELDAWFEPTPDGYRVLVEDAGARYPVEIDPVYTTASWEVAGVSGYPYLGDSVTKAGDVNGDGFDDVVVGTQGAAYVYLGSSSGLATEAQATLEEGGSSRYSGSMSAAGDVNADGYDDLVVSDTSYGTSRGRVWVYLGSATGMTTSASTTLTGSSTSYGLGTSVSGAGDVNGDGYADILVGTGNEGEAFLHLGSASGIATVAATTLSSTTTSFGISVAAAGDVNGDGYADVAVGETAYGPYYTGRVLVYLGSATGLSTSASASIVGGARYSYFGSTIAAAGDVDGDGYDDLLVGVPNDGYTRGSAQLFHGSAAGLSSAAATTFAEASASELYGDAMAGVGDVDGDGYDDIVIGGSESDETGTAYLYAGSIAGVSSTATLTLTGEGTDGFGSALSGAGDVNGDGFDDLLVGAPGVGSGYGRAYVYNGAATGLTTTAATTLDSTAYLGLGRSVADAGDVNADGYDDVIVGAPGYLAGTGAAFVYTGSDTGLATTAATMLTGAAIDDRFGASVAGAGDVNADGYDDVIVGAYGYSSYTGRAFVHHGSAAGVATTAATTLTGAGTSYYFGYAAAGAGDVNGDGYDDVIVGAYGYSSSKGRAYVYRGSASGISTTIGTTLTGGASSDNFGRSVAAAGDVNGDGYDDIIVGARGYSSNTGAAYVHVGSASGTSSSATTLTGYSASNYFGCAVAGAGDVNGDGYDDVIVGAYGYTSNTGRAYVYHGASSGLGTSPRSVMTGTTSGDELGNAVAGVGDVDGDGYDDVIVAAVGYSSDLGRASVYPGSSSGVSSTASATLTGIVSGEEFGYAVSGAGDVDGDGYPDVIVGSYDDGGRASLYRGYADADGDGVGVADDCDDADATVSWPYAVYADADGDGYGDLAASTTACATPSGYVTDTTDCDDGDAAIHPAAGELCDGTNVDEDCDGLADDLDPTATGKATVYSDGDGDGYGSAAADFCDVPSGYVAAGGDCDDADGAVSPAATEVCDAAATDEDCDGLVDDADASVTGRSIYALDADGDGYGSATTAPFCTLPSGYAATTDDCDDANATIHPGASEVCDAADADEDCDGLADDADASAAGFATWHRDADGDGYGGTPRAAYCDAPSGYVADDTDCDDANAGVNPAAAEVCDAADADEDCDALADDADTSATGRTTWYRDADGDGYGSTASTSACDVPSGHVADATDCDDADGAAHPGAVEAVGDDVDGDCDGAETCYTDADADGYRGTGTVASADADCADAGEGRAALPGDCDDTDASVHGGSEEAVADGVDADCDGTELCYADADADGYRDDGGTTVASADLDCADPGEAAEDTPAGDCDETNAAIHPAAAEGNCADPTDYNCDGSVGSADADGDGFAACEECDDARTGVHPDAAEVCNDLDDDCDGNVDVAAEDAVRWYADADGDGYTDPNASVVACDPPEGHAAATEADCDDAERTVHPDATEVADDGIDQDCDGADLVEADTAGDSGALGDSASSSDAGGACGCATGSDAGAAPGVLALGAMALVRRRRRDRRRTRGGMRLDTPGDGRTR